MLPRFKDPGEASSGSDRASTSWVWNFFSLEEGPNGEKLQVCSLCKRASYKVIKSSTSNMRRHLIRNHPEKIPTAQAQENKKFCRSHKLEFSKATKRDPKISAEKLTGELDNFNLTI